jgi:RimJ/RimL family protein N-acetyltransferase
VAPDAVATRFPERVTLRDGSEVVVRPIEPGDKEKLVEGFERLSPESRYRRFLTPMNRLTPRMLRYLTEVDHHDHEALVAESADGAEPVGVARFIRIADEPEAAEVAVAVVNHWQGRGAARALMRRLAARAVEEGVERFTATCLAENTDVLDLLGDLAPARVTESADGLVEVEIALPTGEEKSLLAALRRAAAGALAFRHPLERR